jgi:hypothetical protein
VTRPLPHDNSISRLFEPLDGNALQRYTQGGAKFAQKKSPVAALQPQLVIVDDDDGVAHAHFTRDKWSINFTKV